MANDKTPSISDVQKKNAAAAKALGTTKTTPWYAPKPAPKATPKAMPKTTNLITTPWNTGGAVAGYSLGGNMSTYSAPKAPVQQTFGLTKQELDRVAANSGIGVGYKPGTYAPAPAPAPAPPVGGGGGAAPKTKYMTPDQLYVDPTPAYQPVLDFLKQQEQSQRDRYAVNAANMKNIFGSLTSLTAADSTRITKQFTDSLTASKADLAARTAEARAGAAAGVEQAIETGAERGGGDAMVASPIQLAAEEGIARSNEYATTWQELQRVNEAQTLADISARGAGYGQQEVGAIQQLAQNLEDRLLAIGGNTAQVQSDIAQAKFGQEKDIQQVKFQLSEQAKAAAQAAAAAAAQKPSYGRDIFGLRARMNDAGIDFEGVAGEVGAAYESAYTKLNTINGAPRTTAPVKPSAAEVKAAWNAMYGTSKTAPYAQSYIDLQF
jgi:hypothetical protein